MQACLDLHDRLIARGELAFELARRRVSCSRCSLMRLRPTAIELSPNGATRPHLQVARRRLRRLRLGAPRERRARCSRSPLSARWRSSSSADSACARASTARPV